MKARGLFITIEGIDGAGKGTQIDHICSYMETEGIELILLREPGGTSIGEQIRGILLGQNNAEMKAMTELLLFAAARAQLVREVIEPALAEGKWILCDRFFDSTLAYQAGGLTGTWFSRAFFWRQEDWSRIAHSIWIWTRMSLLSGERVGKSRSGMKRTGSSGKI